LATLLSLGSKIALAKAATPSVKIGRHEITLGLPADKLIAELQQDYAVESENTDQSHKWFVSAGKNTIPIGVVYARGNAVTGVEYMLRGRETNSPQDLFDALFEAAAKLSEEGRNTCAITTWSGYVADASLTKAGISFGVWGLPPGPSTHTSDRAGWKGSDRVHGMGVAQSNSLATPGRREPTTASAETDSGKTRRVPSFRFGQEPFPRVYRTCDWRDDRILLTAQRTHALRARS
jgi:hypothetical protein